MHHLATQIKNNFGHFPCTPFLRRETGKLSGSRLSDYLQIRINTVFRYALCQMDISEFSGQNKVKKKVSEISIDPLLQMIVSVTNTDK